MRLSQDGGHNSTNYQAQGNITVNAGLGVAEVLDLAERVVRANMKDLADVARETAEERIHTFAQRLSHRLEDRPAGQRAALTDPDVQYAISNAGIAYARRGTEELSELLLDLVSDRVDAPMDSLMASVLNDAIEITPRLTRPERALLAVAWTFLGTVQSGATSLEQLNFYHQPVLRAFGPYLPKHNASYLHLQSMGCISRVAFFGNPWADLWKQSYPGFFQAGLTLDLVADDLKDYWDDLRVFEPSPRGEELKQVAGGGASDLYLAQLGLPEAHIEALKVLRDRHLPDPEIEEMVNSSNPDLHYLLPTWKNLRSTTLSAVGIAIAHAIVTQRLGQELDLAVWLSEG